MLIVFEKWDLWKGIGSQGASFMNDMNNPFINRLINQWFVLITIDCPLERCQTLGISSKESLDGVTEERRHTFSVNCTSQWSGILG